MNTIKYTTRLLPLLLAMLASDAMAYQLDCPRAVETVDAKPELVASPKNWQALVLGSWVQLDSAAVSLGPTEQLGFLKPEQFKFNNKIYDWQFTRKDFEKFGVWFSCSYNNGQVVLTREITEPVSACRLVTTKKTDNRILFKEIILECE